jgi:hypothetical protein
MPTTKASSVPLTIAAALALVLMALASGVPAAESFQKLAGAQIQSRFAGMEMTDGVHWTDVYQRTGALAIYAMGRKTTGKWRVGKNELCIDRGPDDSGCYQVWLAGKKVELRREGSGLPVEGVLQKPTERR